MLDSKPASAVPQTALSGTLRHALALHRSGKLDEARPLYERLLRQNPDDADTLHYLGVLLYQCGEYAAAETRIRDAISRNHAVADYFNHLGEVLRAQHRLEEAVRCYEQALDLAPESSAAHNNLGLCLVTQGKPEKALRHFRRALHGDTLLAEAAVNLGDALRSLGRLGEALDAYDAAAADSLWRATAGVRRGYTLLLLGRHREALHCFESLCSERGCALPSLLGMAEAYAGIADSQAARETYTRALTVEPHCGAAHSGLARLYAASGAVADAVTAWRSAIEVEPGEREHYLGLMELYEGEGATDALLELCETARQAFPADLEVLIRFALALVAAGRHAEAVAELEHAAGRDTDHAPLYNALGIALQRSGRVVEAKRCFCRAIELEPGFAAAHSNLGAGLLASGEIENARRELETAVEIDPRLAGAWQNLAGIEGAVSGHRARIARVQDVLEHAGLGSADRASLNFALAKMYEACAEYDDAFRHFKAANALRRALVRYDPDRHEAHLERIVSVFDEARLRRGLSGANSSRLPLFILGMPRSGTTLVEQILSSHPQVHAAGELPFFDELSLRSTTEGAASRKYIDCLDELDGATVRLLADTYLTRLVEGSDAKTRARATDKMLSNYLHLGFIHMLFPQARVVYCRRNPMDVCLSVFFHAFTDMPFAWDLEEIGRYYRGYERLMAHWQRVFGDHVVLELEYERLVADQRTVTGELLDHCGLPWDDACVDFHRNTRPVLTASDWQVRQPIYSSSVGRWKHYLTHLEPLRLALG